MLNTLRQGGLWFVWWRHTRQRSVTLFLPRRWKTPDTNSKALELKQTLPEKLISRGLILVLGMKTSSMNVLLNYSVLHI